MVSSKKFVENDMFTIRHRKKFDGNRYPASPIKSILEVVVAYAIYSICLNVGLLLAAPYTFFY
jgi:hypothetical protein